MLKTHCEKHGLKMFAFVEKLIAQHCKAESPAKPVQPRKDIYGD